MGYRSATTHHRASGKQLLESQTLVDAVKSGDVLRLQPKSLRVRIFAICDCRFAISTGNWFTIANCKLQIANSFAMSDDVIRIIDDQPLMTDSAALG